MTAARRRMREAAIRLFAEKGSSQISMSELAQAAGVARGTAHNNLESPDAFFREIASELAEEMNDRITISSEGICDPAQRLAFAIRFYVRRAHEEPDWGRFLLRFAISEQALQAIWLGPPMRDLLEGQETGVFDFRIDQTPSAVSFIGGSVLSAIMLVLDGHRTWRDAGQDAVELALRALGMPGEVARGLAGLELPLLCEWPATRKGKGKPAAASPQG
ncbi:TetR/AcrR family transcriptional regulator [Niveispirillum sp.]|uniref:TetR/AcrR family transcriptional regulator n=1 Tax=Niveispirillum sp. TaxID=1917217 RepID=UPI001B70100B|nr:TetR/AcrR family transcriptional regulator [Niveispirillum sp.]MBP7338625.1 TetR/AcrR family transcriptional regulator [Niveispirillum sp.]